MAAACRFLSRRSSGPDPGHPESDPRAATGTRTQDLVLTKDALYQLSHGSVCMSLQNSSNRSDALRTRSRRLGVGSRPGRSILPRLLQGVRPGRVRFSPTERVMGIEPTLPAWKAGTLPLSYTRNRSGPRTVRALRVVGGAGFEPAKAVPPDLQSGPFGRLGIHPVGLTTPFARTAGDARPRLLNRERLLPPDRVARPPARRTGQSWR